MESHSKRQSLLSGAKLRRCQRRDPDRFQQQQQQPAGRRHNGFERGDEVLPVHDSHHLKAPLRPAHQRGTRRENPGAFATFFSSGPTTKWPHEESTSAGFVRGKGRGRYAQ